MKKVFILICAALVCGGCSITLQNAMLGHDFSNDNIDIRLKEENYHFVKMVTGEAKASYIFCIGGLSEQAKNIFNYSYQDMVKNANLKPNQAIINVTAEKRANLFFYPIFARQVVHTTGMVIEFGAPKEIVSSIANPTPNKVDKTYKIGDLYEYGDEKGIVVAASEDGKHGKIISLKQGRNLAWSTTQELRGCNSSDNGKRNCEFIANLNSYPAIEWCVTKGWYLPSVAEMQDVYKNLKIINKALKSYGGKLIAEYELYWTSTEHSKTEAIAVQSTYYLNMLKNDTAFVIAMAEF